MAIIIKQQVALAAKAGYQGLGNISGVLGLAFLSITQGFAGNDTSLDRQRLKSLMIQCLPRCTKLVSYLQFSAWRSLAPVPSPKNSVSPRDFLH
jgi:hypothetical protein